ncbi:MAG: tol-pal system protein YbgF [Halothiobacillaceae bacterium]|nr:tol-pal system protein YbgF [Halothiobacillaceae bacterium]
MKQQHSNIGRLGWMPKTLTHVVAVACLLGAAAPSLAEPLAMPAQSVLSEMMSRQQQMQAELNELRDLVERQGYELEMLKRSNKEAYMDTDQRIRALVAIVRPTAGAGSVPTEVTPVPTTPAIVPTAPPPPPVVVAPPAQTASADDQAKYDQGLKLLRAGQYQPAIKMFDQVIKVNPASPNRPNALYWTGEAYVVLGDLKSALNAFEQVVQGSPAHQKAADAQLKMGYIYYDQKNYARARETLNKVKTQFPGTQAATLADQRLKRMQSEGV